MRLLLIEDDKALGKAIHAGLRDEYACDWFQSAEEGEDAMRTVPYDMLVLDINLPGASGLQLLASLRKKQDTTPVLLLTARDAPAQRVEGLDAGADDYLIKPFDFEELLARIRALLRRRGHYQPSMLCVGDVEIDVSGKRVTHKGKTVALSQKEFDILHVLAEQQGRVISKEQIEQKIYDWDSEFESNTIEVHVSAIRRKLGRDLIKTIRGLGYLMERHA